MNNYVKNHDYGYKAEDDKKLHKLELRNFNDLKAYVEDVFVTMLAGKLEGNVFNFNSGKKEQFFVEKL